MHIRIRPGRNMGVSCPLSGHAEHVHGDQNRLKQGKPLPEMPVSTMKPDHYKARIAEHDDLS